MRYLGIFLMIGLLAGVRTAPFLAAEDAAGILSVGHPGLPVSELQRALHFYIDQLGLKEAFRLHRPDGKPMLVYLHVGDSNTFVELFPGMKGPSSPEPPTGYHFNFFVKDLQATLRTLQARGYPLPADAFEEAAKIQLDGTMLYFIKDPDGNRIELSQLTPQSLEVKAVGSLLKLANKGSSAGGAEVPTSLLVKGDAPILPFPSGKLRVLLQGKTEQLSSFTLGTLDMSPGQTLGPETHPEEELIEVFTEGQGEVSLDGRVTKVGPGTVMYVAAKHTQRIVNSGQAPLSYCWFKWQGK
jgi:lactoylglutathione lyase